MSTLISLGLIFNVGKLGIVICPNSLGYCKNKHLLTVSSYYHYVRLSSIPMFVHPLCVRRHAWYWEYSYKQDGPGLSPGEAQGLADLIDYDKP